jgi:hypothetical protein
MLSPQPILAILQLASGQEFVLCLLLITWSGFDMTQVGLGNRDFNLPG